LVAERETAAFVPDDLLALDPDPEVPEEEELVDEEEDEVFELVFE